MNELLKRLSEDGIELWTDGAQLRYRGPRQALTASALAEIKEKKTALLERLKNGYVAKTFPLSFPQRSLWYIAQSAPNSAAYNTALAVRLRFDPDEVALRAALQSLVVRHPSLRTTFAGSDGAGGLECVQRVFAYREVPLEKIDASAWADTELEERVQAAHRRPFDLERGPVIRASLFNRGEDDHVLLLSIHHIVCDGWSMWLLMDELWRTYAEAVAPTPVVAPPSQAALDRLGPQLASGAKEEPDQRQEGGRIELQRLVQRGVAKGLEAMGAWRDGGCTEEALRSRLGILPRYRRLFAALVEILVEAKAVSISSDGVLEHVSASGAKAGDGDALRGEQERLKRAFPELDAYVDLTAACLEALPQVLVGKKDGMEVLFPGGSTELVEKTYRGNAIADANNECIASFVQSYVEERLRAQPSAVVRILEVGAGTGGTTAAVLRALSEHGRRGRVVYQYTDVSPAFARYGERTFGREAPFVEFETLDVEKSPVEQGFEAGSVDVVIASHVLHATRRIDVSLGNVKRLLKKNGLLILNETTNAQAFLTVTFGLTDGWWRFEDGERRMKGSPLLDRALWQRALEAKGFGAVRCANLVGAGKASLPSVIVAASDGVVERGGARWAPAAESYERFVCEEAEMLAGAEGERHWQYWQRQLGGSLPALDLPLDRQRPAVRAYQGRWIPFRISEELTEQLRRSARERQVTIYALLLAAYEMLLHRYSAQEDIIVGCPTAGRHDQRFDRVVGHFVNTVPVRVDLSGDPSVDEVVGRTREALLGAIEHQALPFPAMVERLNPRRDSGRPPVFQTMFVFQEPPKDLSIAEVVTDFYAGNARASIHGLEFESFPVSQQEGQFDLSIEVIGVGASLKGVLKYDDQLFEPSSMERMSRHYVTLLQCLVDRPHERVSELLLLADGELEQIVSDWNDTSSAWELECVHSLVEAQARQTPRALAVVFEGQQLTYGELDRRANQLARRLIAEGVAAEELVGVCLERSVEMIVGVLGILKAGCAYVPLDPHYPKERLAFILDDASVRVLLTSEDLADCLPFVPERAVYVDRDRESLAATDGAALDTRGAPSQLAYVLYTSGSSGRPKGVEMPHGPLCNLLRWQQERSAVRAEGRTLQLTTLNFDVSFQEIFATLTTGGTLVLLEEELRQDPEGILRLIRDQRVERLFVPFVVLKLLADVVEGDDGLVPTTLKEIITAGEQLKITPALAGLMEKLHGCTLDNQYGPTEAHVVTAHLLEGPPSTWPYLPPIGRPISNARIYLVDAKLRPVPPGVPGELLIGGACLARGYHRQEELTEERFINGTFGNHTERLYRTGDLARYRADGTIEFLGRADQQVKVNGFRIELAEVEKQLATHAAISEAVVSCHEDDFGVKRLCAYFVRQGEVDAAELKAYLQERLPSYMVPSAFAELPAIPLTPNKKADRRALPPPPTASLSGRFVAPRDEIEATLVELCRTMLKLERLGVEDNLFDAGVNSLTTLSIQRRIDKAYPGRISVPDLMRFPTIGQLAAAIRNRTTAAPPPSEKAEQYQRFLEALGKAE